ncbi:hypothetical protein PHLGIDRAFT_113776 [Phlebiopsis gigantea 11061_1 CR5-6]|uniref:RRN6 K-rich C-terminal domain-containing protein n=1 Tax=Phlebiopsis gigantea (strain 11061_1 CR5-6) TaxID=745531 RepID=A0A0C3SFL6_PHLG1|nr:hypothetical protein PHLGIDRAFT_113776 [Phlebiopsis gigantea 11061_1 CR5-6]
MALVLGLLCMVKQSSVPHQAEQGANFLRTHYPDVDIVSDLIRDELAENARLASQLQDFDPYLGSLLTPVISSGRSGRQVAFLAFPMGPTGAGLNISPIGHSKKDLTTFKPLASPVRTFETPIQQIIARQPQSSRSECVIAVRTAGSTKLLEVKPRAATLHGIITTELAAFTRSNFGDRPLMDMAFCDMHHSTLLCVNDHGNVFTCKLEESYPTQAVYVQTEPDLDLYFSRLACLPESNTPLLLSAKRLRMLDLRISSSIVTLATASSPKTVFTCVEGPSVDNLIRLASTEELTWIDPRFALRPVFGVKHTRAWDRTLRIHNLTLSDSTLTFLTSAKNALITVYDVSAGKDGFRHLNSLPHVLPSTSPIGGMRVGQVIFRHPNDADTSTAVLLQMNDRGSIHRIDFGLREPGRITGRTHEWTQEVFDLERAMATSSTDVKAFDSMTYTEVDAEPIYQRIFVADEQKPVIEDPAVFYDTLDAMPTFWRNLDSPVEQVLTTFDIAFRSGDEPSDPSRADFLTGSSLSSVRGYRALAQDRIPRDQISKPSPWHHNWTSSLVRFVPDMSESVQDTQSSLKRYDLLTDDYRPGPSIRAETESRQELNVDLFLSADVYAPHAIAHEEPGQHLDDDAFETMSRATEAMSIGIPEPPAVQFSFLRPVPQDHYHRARDVESKKMECPLGVRLLLGEWEIGADPEAYQYRDPYDNAEPLTAVPPWGARHKADKAPRTETKSQPVRMPPVIATAPMAPPPVASQPVRPRPVAPSQGAHVPLMGSQPLSSSQPSQETPFPSTQVLPGPFGGRPAPVKKKPTKKRMGGF